MSTNQKKDWVEDWGNLVKSIGLRSMNGEKVDGRKESLAFISNLLEAERKELLERMRLTNFLPMFPNKRVKDMSKLELMELAEKVQNAYIDKEIKNGK